MSGQHTRAVKSAGEPAAARPNTTHAAGSQHGISNQLLQQYMRNGTLRAKLRVGSADDPAEAEADGLAEQLVAGRRAPCHCGGTCPSCRSNAQVIRRQAIRPGAASARADIFGNRTGRALAAEVRSYFEPRLGLPLDAVRVHDDPASAAMAHRIGARAFAVGSDIGFETGAFRPGTPDGSRLLAHELAHVAQGGELIRRQPTPDANAPENQVQADVTAQGAPVAEPLAPTGGSLDDRVAAFKQLVKTAAVHRLTANRTNLGQWKDALGTVIPASDVSALGLLQGGGAQPYFELQDISDPGMRDLRAAQSLGHFRACTGCHIENYLWGSREQRAMEASPGAWQTPNQMRMFGGPASQPGYQPRSGTYELRLNQLFPDPAATHAAIDRMRAVISALGPDGYQVLPGNLTATLESDGPAAALQQILAAIVQRQQDYLTLIGKIDAGDVGYEHFGPIIKSLLPASQPDVQAAIQKEMDDHAFWNKVEAVVVGALTALALILTIFPPTTVAGVALSAALDVTLGVYGVTKGQEMMRIGEAYSLGTGASDVFSPEQQAAGGAMVLMGFFSEFTGALGAAGGLARVDAALAGLGGGATALTTGVGAVARTIQRGDFLATIAEDGAMYVTHLDHPDMLIVVRGDIATVYQMMPGGMRVIATAPVPPAITSVPLLGPGSEAMVPFEGGPLVPMVGGEAGAPALSGELGFPGAAPGSPMFPQLPAGPPPPFMLGPGPPSPLLLAAPQYRGFC